MSFRLELEMFDSKSTRFTTRDGSHWRKSDHTSLVMFTIKRAVLATGAAMFAFGAQANFATFDSVVTFTDLRSYQEDGMWITVDKDAYVDFDPTHGNGGGFSGGFFYPNGGANGASSISMVDGSVMSAISFTLGDGYSGPNTYYHFWAYVGATLVDDGFGEFVSGGTFSYSGSFDKFRIGATTVGGQEALTPDDFQAVALDNVRTEAVPEPTTMAMLGLGVAAMVRRRVRK